MKLWMTDTQTPTHRLVRINCEEQLGYQYLGDLSESEIRELLRSMKEEDVEKNMKLLQYYGYLHIFIIQKD